MSYPVNYLMRFKATNTDVHKDLLDVENSHLLSNPETIDKVFNQSSRKEPPGLRKKDPTLVANVMEEDGGRERGGRYHRGRGGSRGVIGGGSSSSGRGRGGGQHHSSSNSNLHKNPIIASLLDEDKTGATSTSSSSTSSSSFQPHSTSSNSTPHHQTPYSSQNKKQTFFNSKGGSRGSQINGDEEEESSDSEIDLGNNKAKAAAETDHKLDIFARRRNVTTPTGRNNVSSNKGSDRFARPPDPHTSHYSSSRFNSGRNNNKQNKDDSSPDGGERPELKPHHSDTTALNRRSRFSDMKPAPHDGMKRSFSDPAMEDSSLFYSNQTGSNKDPYNSSSRKNRFTNSRFGKKPYEHHYDSNYSSRTNEDKLLKPSSFASQNDPFFVGPSSHRITSPHAINSKGSIFAPLDESKHKPPGEIGRKPISPQPDFVDTWKHTTDLAVNPGEIGGKKPSPRDPYRGAPAPPSMPSSSKSYDHAHYESSRNSRHPPYPPERSGRYREDYDVHLDEKLYEHSIPSPNYNHSSSSDRRRAPPRNEYENPTIKPPPSSSLHTMFPNHEPPAPKPQGKEYAVGITKGEKIVLRKPEKIFVHSKETYRSLLCRILKNSKFGDAVELKYMDGHVNTQAKLDNIVFEDNPKDIWYLTKDPEPEKQSPKHNVITPAYEKQLRKRLEAEIRQKLEKEMSIHYSGQLNLEKETHMSMSEELRKAHEQEMKNWERERNLLDKKCSNLEKKIKMQEESILEEKENFERKRGQYTTLKQTLDRFTKDNETHKERIRELEKENRKLQNDEAKSKSQKRASDLENQLNQKKNYIDILQATLTQKSKENENLEEEINKLKLENGRLKKSLLGEDDWGSQPAKPVSKKVVSVPAPEPVPKKTKKKKKKEKVKLKPEPKKVASKSNPWSTPTPTKTTNVTKSKKATSPSMASIAKKKIAKPSGLAPRRLAKPSAPRTATSSTTGPRKLSKPSASTLNSQTASFLDDWEVPSSRKTVKGPAPKKKSLADQFGDKNMFDFKGENANKKKKKKKKIKR